MELKVTTMRALEFEEKTGQDIIEVMKEIGETSEIKVRTVVALFEACGENYTVEKFDEWDASFTEKSTAILTAVADYIGTAKKSVKKGK